MNSVKLTDDELLLLDNKVGEEVQSKINGIKAARELKEKTGDLNENQSKFIIKVIQTAVKDGRLRLRNTHIRVCEVCEKRAGYATYSRSSRHHRKGDLNYDKPQTMFAKELSDSLVSIQGYATCGCCAECYKILEPHIKSALTGVKSEIHESITGNKPVWKKTIRATCTKCNWTGLETELKTLPCLMEGRYPGECPSCGAKNQILGPRVITFHHDQIVVVPANESVLT